PGTPLANPKSLMFVSGELKNLEASPVAAQAFQRGFKEQWEQALHAGAKIDRREGIGLLRKLGAPGLEKIREVEAAPTIEDGAKIIDDYFNSMDPKAFQKLLGKQQGILGRLGARDVGKDTGFKAMGAMPWLFHMMNREGAVIPYTLAVALQQATRGYASPL